MRSIGVHASKRTNVTLANLAVTFNALVILGILALAAVSWASLDYFRIKGALYSKIVNSKDLVADILPPPLYVIEAYQEVTDLRDTPEDIDGRSRRLVALHEKFVERQNYWANSTIDARLKNRLIVDSFREGQRFWKEIEANFLPAIRSGDRDKAVGSFDRIRAAYAAHRSIVDDVVKSANEHMTGVEQEAGRREDLLLSLVLATTIISLYMAALAIRLIRSKIVGPLIQLADYMTKTPRDKREGVPFLERLDEIGTVAQAVDAFRSTVERRIIEEQKAQLDAALNNIVQGVEMYDADNALVLCNERFIQIYGVDRQMCGPGKTLGEIIHLRMRVDLLWEERVDDLRSKIELALTSPDHREFYSHLGDGRCILISVRPLSDRGGFVITHEDVTEQRRSAEKIAYYAHHDSLTGLPNRVRLNEELERALAYARRGEMVAVHVLDFDNFKAVNDTLGHPIGDKLLSTAAQRLKRQLRETDTIARMGGDEFAVVERQIANPVDAVALANRLIKAVAEPFEIDGHSIAIGTSIGIGVGPRDGTSAEDIMRNADLALYRAKADGRGTFRFFEPAMDAEMQERCQMERELRNALSNHEFELHFQPVVNVDNNEICAFEALIRWRHPVRGLVSPAVFIPLAEETRLIVPIGAWVLKQACFAAATWPDDIKIAVNLSPVQFRSDDVAKVVGDALSGSGLAPGRLEIEITESLLLDGNEATLATLYHLRNLGVRVAMDDFGTGYSSLSYLQSFPFDKIKIDKSFVQGIGTDPKSLNIVRAVATLANGLGIQTTAEGVESAIQLEAVRSEGCSEVQGFLMSRPLALNDVHLMLKARGYMRAGGQHGPSVADCDAA